MTNVQVSIIENTGGNLLAESPCISSRPENFKAEVTALKSEFVTRLNQMQQLILESNASTSQRLDVLEQRKVRPLLLMSMSNQGPFFHWVSWALQYQGITIAIPANDARYVWHASQCLTNRHKSAAERPQFG